MGEVSMLFKVIARLIFLHVAVVLAVFLIVLKVRVIPSLMGHGSRPVDLHAVVVELRQELGDHILVRVIIVEA